MLHPSYTDLMEIINERNEDITLKSRYSIVIATSKRARNIIDNGYIACEERGIPKPLSCAVDELYKGAIDIA